MKRLIQFAILLLLGGVPLYAQIINCASGFTTTGTGACSISNSSATDDFWTNSSPILSGSAAVLAPSGAGHQGWGLIRQTKVNVQGFTANWTFIMNGYNHAFVIQNDSTQNGQTLSSGAGGEGGFSQMAGSGNIAPNNLFALMLDSYSPLTEAGSFTYSSAQWYESLQTPPLPIIGGGSYLPVFPITKLSTFPVPLNSPASTAGTFTGDTYSATVTYDGYTLTLSMFDVTAGGSCPGSSCYTQAWTGVYIPSIVGGTTAWVGFTAGTATTTTNNLDIKTFTYTVNTATGSPSYTAYNANSTYNTGVVSSASPVFSVAPGTYSGTQSVAITTSGTPNNYICYTLSATPLTPASSTLYPHPDNNGGCAAGTLYTGAVSVSSTSTLYAMAGSNNSAFALGSQTPTGLGPPSTLVAGTYTISAAQTWFVRTDGGTRYSANVTAGQCDGKADVSYASTGGTGTNQHCAFNDFRYLWDDHSGTVGMGAWVISGGDTVVVRGCTAITGGTRPQINPSNPDCRLGWDAPSGYNPPAFCYAVGNQGCYNPQIPAGTSGQHTRFLGGCAYDSTPGPCSTGNVRNNANLTQLFAGEDLVWAFNLKNTSYIDIVGIELTNHNKVNGGTAFIASNAYTLGQTIFDGANTESVTTAGTSGTSAPTWAPWIPTATSLATTVSGTATFTNLGPNCLGLGLPSYPVACQHGTAPYDDYGVNGFLTSNTTSNILFQDVYVHGFSSAGFYGPIGGPITMTRTESSMNAFAGWNFDQGTTGPNSTGFPDNPLATITASYVTMDWNGCNEEYPIVHALPLLSCYSILNNGFGDAWSGQNTHFASFTGDHLEIANNVKDAFFGPHTSIGAVTLTNSYAGSNGGQTWKGNLGHTGTFLMRNSVTNGNCRRFARPFTGLPPWFQNNVNATDMCRADGATFAFIMPVAGSFEIDNNTFVSASRNVSYDLVCWSVAGSIAPNLGGTGYAVGDTVYIGSNVIGQVSSISGGGSVGPVTGLTLIDGSEVPTATAFTEVYTFDLTTPTASGLTVNVSSFTPANCNGGTMVMRNNNFMAYTNPNNVGWNGTTIIAFCYSSCGSTPGTISDTSWTTRSNNNFWDFGNVTGSGACSYPGETCVDPLMTNEPSQTWTNETALDIFNPHTPNNAFYPTSGSTVLNGAGITYTGIPSTDYFGVAYSSPPPIGAAMSQGGVQPPTGFSGNVSVTGKAVLQ